MSEAVTTIPAPVSGSARKPVKRSVTPRLRRVLYVVLGLFSLLLANGLYLSGVTWLQYFTGRIYESHFYQLMFLSHLGLGLLLIVPVIGFGLVHMWRAKDRRNRRAVKIGYALFAAAIVILVSGVLLMRIGGFAVVNPTTRNLIYWAHFLTPAGVIWLYWLHRLVGPKIKWHIGRRVAIVTAGFASVMVAFQASDPSRSEGIAPIQGEDYFKPSLARTSSGNFIAEETLMNDDYCLRCHEDIYDTAIHSAHKLSSFNNPAYRASVRETREVANTRHGTLQASRWCAGCHDPVPFFTGKFDDPNYDDVGDATAHAGITCTVCHAIQSVDSVRGNADYVIDEPKHYPFAYSDNPVLAGLNSLMVKAKPAFHKHEMLKPFHKTAEFCSTCHKVSLPRDVTDYRDFLRGQNHYDSYLLSGVSGHGARSFYYPPKAQDNCNECHMPAMASDGFGAKYRPDIGGLAVHNHAFPSANTALAHWMGDDEAVERHRAFLKDNLRVDLFGIRRDGRIDGELVAPLGDRSTVVAGETVLIETVLRTLKVGHHFTQGTSDSNQVWVEWIARQGGHVIAGSGMRDDRGVIDNDAHFVNTFMLDRHGNRINRRNAQDIFTPLYSHQMPPGAGQTLHYRLDVPDDTSQPIEVTARLLYRKFDTEYLDYVRRDRDPERDPLDLGQPGDPNDLPIIEIGSDSLTLNVVEADDYEPMFAHGRDDDGFPTWQRWNDYGIGLLLTGRTQLKQAAEAFERVGTFDRYDGPLNLARVQWIEGDLDAATRSLAEAAQADPPPPSWTHSWLSGVVNRGQGNLQQAADSLRAVLETKVPERGFDFSADYVVRNELGQTLLDLAQRDEVMGDDEGYRRRIDEAIAEFEGVLEFDSEDAKAHSGLAIAYSWIGDDKQAARHRSLQNRYKMDENASEIAVPVARSKYPAADRASQPAVIYDTSMVPKSDLAMSR